MKRYLFVGVKREEALLVSAEEDSSEGLRLSCIYQHVLAWCIQPVETGVEHVKTRSTIGSEYWTSFALGNCSSRLWMTAHYLEVQVVAVGLEVSKLTDPEGRLSSQTANFGKL
jgi:hypothetical protein